jgi:hypothetical protein
MFKTIFYGKAMPYSFPLDPSVEFLPGMVAQLTVIGGQQMATVSDGTAPIGIIDDIRTRSFTAVSWNEVIIVPASGSFNGAQYVSVTDINAPLAHPSIIAGSFTSTVRAVLNPNNGILTFLTGTPLNYDLTGSGIPNAIKAVVNYTYNIPNIPGDDSTMGSGKVTVWYERFMFETAQFETNCSYAMNANLYVSEKGFLTSRKPSKYHPSVGMVINPPNPIGNSMLQVLWW